MAKKRKLQLDADTAMSVHIVLDQSSSMTRVRSETIDAINTYVADLAKETPDCRISLTLFDTRVETVRLNELATEFTPLTEDTYKPNGYTALYDGIASAAAQLDTSPGTRKVLVILTDGEENASRSATQISVRATMLDRQENQNWLIQYLAANQDAFQASATIGLSRDTTMSFAHNAAGTAGAMGSATASAMRYASSNSLRASSFTDAERADALGDTDPNA